MILFFPKRPVNAQSSKHYTLQFPSNNDSVSNAEAWWPNMHYNSYVPELDLKPVQFLFNHQVSILIIHIPNAEITNGVCYISTERCVMGAIVCDQ